MSFPACWFLGFSPSYAQKYYTDSTFTSLADALKVPLQVINLSIDAEKEANLMIQITNFANLHSLEIINLKEFTPNLVQFLSLRKLVIKGSFSTMPEARYGVWYSIQRLTIDAELTSLPNSFDRLTTVKMLDLSNNKLTTLPPSLFEMRELQQLYVNNNPLTEIPAGIEKLQKLEYLECERGQIKIIPETIGNLPVLESLKLENNLIERIPIGITKSKSLKFIIMGNNRLKEIPAEIVNMSKLEYLVIDTNPIEDLPDDIAKMPVLWIEAKRTKVGKKVI